ncbi:hypothetical protein DXG01_011815 [Tephrocybe rancida]|nr:hypothetical protein DXG01_011815 [Tephrocybe rancida]
MKINTNLSALLAQAKQSLRHKAPDSELTGNSAQLVEPPFDIVDSSPTSVPSPGPAAAACSPPGLVDSPPQPSKRHCKLPSCYHGLKLTEKRLRDTLPQSLAPLPSAPPSSAVKNTTEAPDVATNPTLAIESHLQDGDSTPIDTPDNALGVYRQYQSMPTHNPEQVESLTSLSNIKQIVAPSYMPYPNLNAFKLGKWYWNEGIQKSQSSFRSLMDIVGSEYFVPGDVHNLNWKSINSELGLNAWDSKEWEDVNAGWHVSEVTIQVPFHRNLYAPGVCPFTVKAFYRHPLVAVIHEKLTLKKEDMRHFHLEPYELMWRPNAQEEPIHLHGEIYTSPSFAKAHCELQSSPREPGCNLPRYVVSLMFWSDGMHLTNFGTASLTPLYLQFGNKSKYRCSYFELPDKFKAFASQYTGKSKIDSYFLSHCRRKLAHTQWTLLLDDKFIEAYQHGIVVEWEDGISRRFYPRIFCYSVDYKEK